MLYVHNWHNCAHTADVSICKAFTGGVYLPVRVPWSQHETALLINAYLQISEGADLTKTANDLSLALRNLAVHAGQAIDDTDRNVNGMKMQLANVQYLFTNGEKGLASPSIL